ncbi:MAG: calcium-binding protein, partial [Pseudomonadota bacterium]
DADADRDAWIVRQGALVSSTDVGFDFGDFEFVTLTVEGAIYGFGSPNLTDRELAIADDNAGRGISILIRPTGTVAGDRAISLEGEDATIVNEGSVVGTSSFGIRTLGDDASVTNSGTISGAAWGVDLVGRNSALINTGVITGGELASTGGNLGVEFGEDSMLFNAGTITSEVGVRASRGGDSTIVNTGTISATDQGIVVSSFFTSDVATLSITNSGTIALPSANDGEALVVFGLTEVTLTNTGLIVGEIELGNLDDLVDGRGGVLRGLIDLGDGNDTMLGGADGEVVQAGDGNDLIRGGDGDDTLRGDEGVDTLYGGAGDDSLVGGPLNSDRLFGGEGHDTLEGGDGLNLLRGGRGDDVLLGGRLGETLQGSRGDDNLTAGAGNDAARGGEGDDTLDGGTGVDTLRGGAGDDLLLGGATNSDAVYGGRGDDTLFGIEGANTLTGGAGDDSLVGGSFTDTLTGGRGDDTLVGGSGSDTFVYRDGHGRDIIRDFGAGDRIDLTALPVPSYAALRATYDVAVTSQGVLIDLGGGHTLTVAGETLASLSNSDFLF